MGCTSPLRGPPKGALSSPSQPLQSSHQKTTRTALCPPQRTPCAPTTRPPLPDQKQRLEAVEGRLKLCRWAAAVSLGIGAGAWSFASVKTEGGSFSLAVFSVAVLVCLIATGAGALLETQRERLQGGRGHE